MLKNLITIPTNYRNYKLFIIFALKASKYNDCYNVHIQMF